MADFAYISGVNSVSIDKGRRGDIVCMQMNWPTGAGAFCTAQDGTEAQCLIITWLAA
jgi:hypothetical protein